MDSTDRILAALAADQGAQMFGSDFTRLGEWLDDRPGFESEVQDSLEEEGLPRDALGDGTAAEILGIDIGLRSAMLRAAASLNRMISGGSGEELARYHEELDRLLDESRDRGDPAIDPSFELDGSPFGVFASCQGGFELQAIYRHPIHGPHPERLEGSAYRRMTVPYVTAFRAELMPGDLRAGLCGGATASIRPAGGSSKIRSGCA